MAILQQILVLFTLIIVGIVTSKLGVVGDDFKKDLSRFILFVAIPAFIIDAMGANFSSNDLSSVLSTSRSLILISILMYGLAIIISFIIAKVMGLDIDERNVMQYAIVFSNVGFMGYPIIDLIYGSEGVFYAAIYNLTFNIFIWTIGVYLITRGKDIEGNNKFYKRMINPGVIAILTGFSLFLFNIKLPTTIGRTLNLVGSLTTPLAMIFIGLSLSAVKLSEIMKDIRGFFISAVRLMIFPLIFYFCLRVIGVEGYLLNIPVIISAMPVAINGAMFAMTFDSDYIFASKLVFLSSFLSLFTIPVLINFLT